MRKMKVFKLEMRTVLAVGAVLFIFCHQASAQPVDDATQVKFFSGSASVAEDRVSEKPAHENIVSEKIETGPADEAIRGASIRDGAPVTGMLRRRQRQAYRLNEEGVELVFHGNRDDGLKKLHEALERDPDNATVLYNIAGLQLANSQPKEAIRSMERAVELEPNDPAFLNRLAQAYFADSNLEKAVQYYEEIVAINPRYGEVLLRLGTIYGMLREWEKAERTLRQAVEVRPRDSQALSNLGSVLVLKKKYQEAEQVLDKAQLVKPTAENAVALGIAYESQGEKDSALAEYRRAQELGDNDPALKKHIDELAKPKEVTLEKAAESAPEQREAETATTAASPPK